MNKVRETKKFLAAAVLSAGIYASFSVIPAYADVATLTGIEISPASNGSYQIMIKADKEVSVEKYVTSGNKIVLDLKNTRPSGFVNTVYNNASKIDHVIVQPVSDEEVRVFLQGTNIADSNISVSTKTHEVLNQVNLPVNSDNSSVNTIQTVNNTKTADNIKNVTKPDTSTNTESQASQSSDTQQTIVLDRPVDNYKPVATIDNENSSNVESPIQSVKNEIGANASLKKIFSTNAFDWLLRFLMLAFIMIAAYKFFVPKKNVKINLSSERSRELELLRSLNKKQGLIGVGLKPQQPNPLKKPGYSSISQYGLKEYQNSQLPPTGIATPKLRNQFNIPRTSIKNDALLRKSNVSTASKTTRTPVSPKIRNSDVTAAKINIDSKKFLETMAQIYEKSGRPDLARGIQNNITSKQV
jgi:hypothetical protein